MEEEKKKVEQGDKGKWYAIHTYSGYENSVEKNLKQRIESLGVQDRIFDVIVPIEKKIKFKNGKRIEEEKNMYPGYVLVNMEVDEETWYIVRNTPRVSGFVGSGVKPVPLGEEEVKAIFDKLNDDNVLKESDFNIGEPVKIIDGPFTDKDGLITEIDKTNEKIIVSVVMFGRDTPIELDFVQVKKV